MNLSIDFYAERGREAAAAFNRGDHLRAQHERDQYHKALLTEDKRDRHEATLAYMHAFKETREPEFVRH